MSNTANLKILAKFCDLGTCPTLYQNEQGKVFVQGNVLPQIARAEIAVAGHEEIVELDPELLDFLRSYQP